MSGLFFDPASGIIAGVLIGIIVYYAQKWTISLFTAFVGARVISGVLTPILWSGILQGEYAGIIEQKVLGPDVELNYSLVRILILVAFCAAGFVIQLKTSKNMLLTRNLRASYLLFIWDFIKE